MANPQNLKPFKPGQSGNPPGRPKGSIGFGAAFRRSEVVGFNVEDLKESELGFKVTIRHSKTDEEGAGQTIAIVRGQRGLPG